MADPWGDRDRPLKRPRKMFLNVKGKVKFSHTRYRALGPELIPVYRQSARRWREVNHAIYPAVVCRWFCRACGYPRSVHQMALPVNGSTHLIPAYYSFYRPRKDERLSWPSWLTYSGWLTHIRGHPSAAGRAQDRGSSPARDRRSTTVPRHQLSLGMVTKNDVIYGRKLLWWLTNENDYV